MSTPAEPRSRFAIAAAGAAAFLVAMPALWMAVTFVAATRAADRMQGEVIGYAMILTLPAAAIGGALAGFVAGLVGDRARWPRRWAALALVGALLAVGFNLYLLHSSSPATRRRPAPAAAPR